ncbi:GNAT family N-acetyltransferase [Dactylosporangium siamense]|nr:GNAT family N-acetyltransferase [Dactylosporangium siamense]
MKSRMEIRRARRSDVETLIAIHQQARRTYYGDLATRDDTEELREAYTVSVDAPDRTVLCVDGDARVAGFLSMKDDQLIGLYVDPAHWQHGIGGALHDAGVDVWRAAGVTGGRLEVWDGNERAKAFYLRRGWESSGERRPGPLDRDFVYLRLRMS